MAERVGVFDRDFAKPNEINGSAIISRNRNDLAFSNCCQRFRLFASVCGFSESNDTRNGTRRDALGAFLPRDSCAGATAAIFLEAFPSSLNRATFGANDPSLQSRPYNPQRLALIPGTSRRLLFAGLAQP
jgi:hypothetical protein